MKYFIPEDITITESGIPQHTDESGTVYDVWSKTGEYSKGKKVSHNDQIFEAFTNIYPLATYSWNDSSNTATPEAIRLSDGFVETPTAVPCVNNETIVYVLDTWKSGRENVVGKYFQFIGTTGNVDLTAVDPNSAPDFTEILNYRHEYHEPTDRKNSIYWKYISATNRAKVVDKSYNSQSIVELATEAWWEFEIDNPDKVVLFNIEAVSARIVVYDTDINNPIYDNTKDSLLDFSSIVDWATLVRYRNKYTKNADWTIPFLAGTYKVRIYITSPTAMDLKLGEILAGESVDLAVTLDGVPIKVKSKGDIVELDNGDVIFEDEGNIAKTYTTFNFSLKFKSPTLDATLDKCAELINRRIVVYAEDSEEGRNRSLVVYGFSRDASPDYKSNWEYSDISLQVQRFI